MSNPYIGEIRMFGGNFAPVGWALCQGQQMPISENDALFALIGTTYGGDGQTTFNLPNLQSRVPVHVGTGFALGQTGGTETVTLTTSQIPSHSHPPACNTGGGSASTPAGNVWAANTVTTAPQFTSPTNAGGALTQMNAGTMGNDGGSQPHDNMIPFQAINFIIALFGVFPSQN
jgi:microcystin-dependent protein